MTNILIVEDELYIRKGLTSLLNQLDKPISIVSECGSVKDAISVVNHCNIDLVLLDINLEDGNAFDFLEQTQNIGFKVIFITAYEEYALKALKNGAVDYIVKPVDIEELEIAIDKALVSIEKRDANPYEMSRNETLVLRFQNSFQVVNLQELTHCESHKGYTTFYLVNGQTHIASRPLKHFQSQLPQSLFVRVHQSYIVNLNYIDRYDKDGTIILQNGCKIPVSTSQKEVFLSKFLG